jgi:hypothetical protein
VHPRDLTLRITKNSIAKGKMTSDDPNCVTGAPVDIQKRKKGQWRKLRKPKEADGHTTHVLPSGKYQVAIPKRNGRYRALSIEFSSPDGMQVCARTVSDVVRHRK